MPDGSPAKLHNPSPGMFPVLPELQCADMLKTEPFPCHFSVSSTCWCVDSNLVCASGEQGYLNDLQQHTPKRNNVSANEIGRIVSVSFRSFP